MKKVSVFIFVSLLGSTALFSQQKLVEAVTNLIVAKKFEDANHLLDSVLKKHPKNVDAWMMKGNVVLNQDMDTNQSMQFITERDESIFYQTISDKPKLVSEKTVKQVEIFWRKCLLMDSTRNDVRKGLCSLYAMALMKDKLKKEIATLAKHEKDTDGELAFRMADYARKLKERNRFVDAVEMYKYIANLFPQVAGIRCDLAEEFFYAGEMKEALAWLDSAFNFKTVDETSFLNGAFTYSQLGYYDNAQSVLNTYSRIYHRKMDVFYYGLRLFADSSVKWAETLQQFVNEVDSNAYFTETTMAKELLACRDSFTFSNYKKLINDKNIPDYYKVLLHVRGMKQFTRNCEPYINYGIFQAAIKNYPAAIQYFYEGQNCDVEPNEKEFLLLAYGYCMYQTDEKKAHDFFQALENSANEFYKQAAKYFKAKLYEHRAYNTVAESLRGEIISAKEKTKYQTLLQIATGIGGK
jgi:tetratricopeptide (TPR) repeat protein